MNSYEILFLVWNIRYMEYNKIYRLKKEFNIIDTTLNAHSNDNTDELCK